MFSMDELNSYIIITIRDTVVEHLQVEIQRCPIGGRKIQVSPKLIHC